MSKSQTTNKVVAGLWLLTVCVNASSYFCGLRAKQRCADYLLRYERFALIENVVSHERDFDQLWTYVPAANLQLQERHSLSMIPFIIGVLWFVYGKAAL